MSEHVEQADVVALLEGAWAFCRLLVKAGHRPSAELEDLIVRWERREAVLWSWSWE
jgi:hypothetical protein